jgi:hypothetical protein
VILDSGLFEDIRFDEVSQTVVQQSETYIDAWRSTRNLKAQAGDDFESVLQAIEKMVEEHGPIEIIYTTRAWTSRKIG